VEKGMQADACLGFACTAQRSAAPASRGSRRNDVTALIRLAPEVPTRGAPEWKRSRSSYRARHSRRCRECRAGTGRPVFTPSGAISTRRAVVPAHWWRARRRSIAERHSDDVVSLSARRSSNSRLEVGDVVYACRASTAATTLQNRVEGRRSAAAREQRSMKGKVGRDPRAAVQIEYRRAGPPRRASRARSGNRDHNGSCRFCQAGETVTAASAGTRPSPGARFSLSGCKLTGCRKDRVKPPRCQAA